MHAFERTAMEHGGDGIALLKIVHDQIVVPRDDDDGCVFGKVAEELDTEHDAVGREFVLGMEDVTRDDDNGAVIGRQDLHERLEHDVVLFEAGRQANVKVGEMEDVVKCTFFSRKNFLVGFHELRLSQQSS